MTFRAYRLSSKMSRWAQILNVVGTAQGRSHPAARTEITSIQANGGGMQRLPLLLQAVLRLDSWPWPHPYCPTRLKHLLLPGLPGTQLLCVLDRRR